jgi:hypothetical protein
MVMAEGKNGKQIVYISRFATAPRWIVLFRVDRAWARMRMGGSSHGLDSAGCHRSLRRHGGYQLLVGGNLNLLQR